MKLATLLLLTACTSPEQRQWDDVVAREHYTIGKPYAGDIKPLLAASGAKWMSYPVQDDVAWHTRAETMALGHADCKGRAIGEYFDLLEAGVSPDRIHIEVLKFDGIANRHMVVAGDDWVMMFDHPILRAELDKKAPNTVEYILTDVTIES